MDRSWGWLLVASRPAWHYSYARDQANCGLKWVSPPKWHAVRGLSRFELKTETYLERSKTHPGCPIEPFNLSCRWRLTRSNLPISRSLVAIAKNLSSNGLFFLAVLSSAFPSRHDSTRQAELELHKVRGKVVSGAKLSANQNPKTKTGLLLDWCNSKWHFMARAMMRNLVGFMFLNVCSVIFATESFLV